MLLTCLKCYWVVVGKVFEVMTQVDHDFIPIIKLDRQLRLIKNWGITAYPPLVESRLEIQF
jgi:hypothetical protein